MNPKILWATPLCVTLIVGFLGLYIPNFDKLSTTSKVWSPIIFAVVIIGVVLITIYNSRIEHLVKNLTFKFKRIYSPYIYDSITVRLEYLKKSGRLVSYEREDFIDKLSLRKSKRIVHSTVEVAGSIVKTSASSINSAYTFPLENMARFQCYFDERDVLEKKHRSSHSLIFKNAFLQRIEYWMFCTDRFCRNYSLDVYLPAGRKLGRIIFEKQKFLPEKEESLTDLYANKKWDVVSNPRVLIRHRPNHTIISVRLSAIHPNRIYKLSWELTA